MTQIKKNKSIVASGFGAQNRAIMRSSIMARCLIRPLGLEAVPD